MTISPPSEDSLFRFLPDGAWIPFDRTLVISAAPSEERAYLLQIQTLPRNRIANAAPAQGSITTFGYLIDKLPPRPPLALPSGGVFHSRISPELSSSADATVWWSVIGPDGIASDFQPFELINRPVFFPPQSGSASFTLITYAVDSAGNRSLPARFVYRLAEEGLQAEAPPPPPPQIAVASSDQLPPPTVSPEPGASTLTFNMQPGLRLLISVNPADPPASLDDYVIVDQISGKAVVRIPCPFGWAEDLQIYYGFIGASGATISTNSVDVSVADLPPPEPPTPVPSAPLIAADPAGKAAFIIFPAYDGNIYLSIDGKVEEIYKSPIQVATGKSDSVKISWVGESDSGRRSARGEISLKLPNRQPDAAVRGAEEGSILSQDAMLTPASTDALIRYEISYDGSLPPEPGLSSPILGLGLGVPCPVGESRSIVLRYRSWSGKGSDAIASEGTTLRFIIDKRPPEVPSLLGSPPPFSDHAISLSFQKPSSGTSIYVSVTTEGLDPVFAPLSGKLELPASDSGPVAYLVRAYSQTRGGIRSNEMKQQRVVIDAVSVYAAADAANGGDGTPSRPFNTLDAAIVAALGSGKRGINLRGSFIQKTSILTYKDFNLTGGFSSDWSSDPSARATLRLAAGLTTGYSVKASKLRLKGIDIDSSNSGPGPVILVENASVKMESVMLLAGSDSDLVAIRAVDSLLEISRSTIQSQRSMSFTAIEAYTTQISLVDTIISAQKGVRIFSAVDSESGSLDITGSLLESSADMGLRLIALNGTSLSMDRTLCRIDSGTGFMRLCSFSNVTGEIRSSKFIVSWRGSATLFDSEGISPDFIHVTIYADGERGPLRFFSFSGKIPRLWNSIFSCISGGSELLNSDQSPLPGEILTNCIWGFQAIATGALELKDAAALDAFNAANSAFVGRRSIVEAPWITFGNAIKNLVPLNPSSACIGAATPMDGRYALDFQGKPRPGLSGGGRPDIGADEAVQ